MIDAVHMKAFGMTLEERRIQKKLQNDPAAVDWESYDAPPSVRKKPVA